MIGQKSFTMNPEDELTICSFPLSRAARLLSLEEGRQRTAVQSEPPAVLNGDEIKVGNEEPRLTFGKKKKGKKREEWSSGSSFQQEEGRKITSFLSIEKLLDQAI